jgi:predicted RNase H-like nuclease (RuvC/YqgF family)
MKRSDETPAPASIPILHTTQVDKTFATEVSLLQHKVEELDKQVAAQKQIMKNALKKLRQGAWGKEWAQVQRQKIKRKNSDGKNKQQEFELLTRLQTVRSEMEINLKSLEAQLYEAQNQLIQKRQQWIKILSQQLEESKQRQKQLGDDFGQIDPTLRIQTSSELEQFIEQQNNLLKSNLLEQSLRLELLRKNNNKVRKLKALERELVGKVSFPLHYYCLTLTHPCDLITRIDTGAHTRSLFFSSCFADIKVLFWCVCSSWVVSYQNVVVKQSSLKKTFSLILLMNLIRTQTFE